MALTPQQRESFGLRIQTEPKAFALATDEICIHDFSRFRPEGVGQFFKPLSERTNEEQEAFLRLLFPRGEIVKNGRGNLIYTGRVDERLPLPDAVNPPELELLRQIVMLNKTRMVQMNYKSAAIPADSIVETLDRLTLSSARCFTQTLTSPNPRARDFLLGYALAIFDPEEVYDKRAFSQELLDNDNLGRFLRFFVRAEGRSSLAFDPSKSRLIEALRKMCSGKTMLMLALVGPEGCLDPEWLVAQRALQQDGAELFPDQEIKERFLHGNGKEAELIFNAGVLDPITDEGRQRAERWSEHYRLVQKELAANLSWPYTYFKNVPGTMYFVMSAYDPANSFITANKLAEDYSRSAIFAYRVRPDDERRAGAAGVNECRFPNVRIYDYKSGSKINVLPEAGRTHYTGAYLENPAAVARQLCEKAGKEGNKKNLRKQIGALVQDALDMLEKDAPLVIIQPFEESDAAAAKQTIFTLETFIKDIEGQGLRVLRDQPVWPGEIPKKFSRSKACVSANAAGRHVKPPYLVLALQKAGEGEGVRISSTLVEREPTFLQLVTHEAEGSEPRTLVHEEGTSIDLLAVKALDERSQVLEIAGSVRPIMQEGSADLRHGRSNVYTEEQPAYSLMEDELRSKGDIWMAETILRNRCGITDANLFLVDEGLDYLVSPVFSDERVISLRALMRSDHGETAPRPLYGLATAKKPVWVDGKSLVSGGDAFRDSRLQRMLYYHLKDVGETPDAWLGRPEIFLDPNASEAPAPESLAERLAFRSTKEFESHPECRSDFFEVKSRYFFEHDSRGNLVGQTTHPFEYAMPAAATGYSTHVAAILPVGQRSTQDGEKQLIVGLEHQLDSAAAWERYGNASLVKAMEFFVPLEYETPESAVPYLQCRVKELFGLDTYGFTFLPPYAASPGRSPVTIWPIIANVSKWSDSLVPVTLDDLFEHMSGVRHGSLITLGFTLKHAHDWPGASARAH